MMSQSREHGGAGANRAEAAASDQDFDFDLIRLLAGLEQLASGIDPGEGPLEALRVVESQLEIVGEFLTELRVTAFPDAMNRTLKLARRKHPHLELVQCVEGRADFEAAYEYFQSEADSAMDRRHTHADLCAGLLMVMDRLFALIGLSYHSEDMLVGWEEMYGTFLHELSSVLDNARYGNR